MIKPIETVYKGYRFRSRLEARWAVFFDAANIRYQYEPEGFDLNGDYYLPDFYLPDFFIYVEIKPIDRNVVKQYIGDGNKWEKKCASFRNITGKSILLCYDDPAEDVYKILFAWELGDSGGGYSERYCMFSENQKGICLMTEPSTHELYLNEAFNIQSKRIVSANDDGWPIENNYNSYSNMLLDRAKTAARQARFEHGEKPII